MKYPQHPIGERRQRGWVGMLGLLLALVIAGLLVRTLLKQMGITERPETPAVTRAPATGNAPADTPAPAAGTRGTSVERARAIEGQVLRQAEEAAERLEAAQK